MPRGTPKRLVDSINETNDRLNTLVIRLEDRIAALEHRIDCLEEDRSVVGAYKELFERVGKLEDNVDVARITIQSQTCILDV